MLVFCKINDNFVSSCRHAFKKYILTHTQKDLSVLIFFLSCFAIKFRIDMPLHFGMGVPWSTYSGENGKTLRMASEHPQHLMINHLI